MLTDEDKKRIEEEERYRLEVRKELKSKKEEVYREQANGNSQTKLKGRNNRVLIGVGILIFLFIILGKQMENDVPIKSTNTTQVFSPTPTIVRRDNFLADVAFTGSQFVISNLDTDDCVSSQMSVNKDYHLDDYTLEAGHTYEVGAGQFAKKDGTRLNPFSTKPLNLYIYCKGNNPLYGADYYAEW